MTAAVPAGRWARVDAVLWRRVAGGVLVLPPSTSDLTVLGGTAADVWEALERPAELAELAGRYGADHTAQLADLLADLARCGLTQRGCTR